MSILNNELFENIITGEYRNDKGRRICGIYTTPDDGAFLISIGRLEAILSGVAEVEPSFEEVYKKYEKQFEEKFLSTHDVIVDEQAVIDKWLAEGKIEYSSKVNRAESAKANLEKARLAHRDRASETKARVLGAILNGNSKTEAANILGLSVSTITNNLNKIKCVSDVEDLFSTYRSSVLAGVDMARLVDFKLAGCNYKAFRKRLADNFVHKINQQNAVIEREAKRKAVELNHYNEGKIEANKILKEMEEKGFTSKSQIKSLEADDTVNFDDIMSMFPVNDNTEVTTYSGVVTTSASKSKISIETADFFAEKYSNRTDTEDTVSSLSTSRRKINPRIGVSSRDNVSKADYGYCEI